MATGSSFVNRLPETPTSGARAPKSSKTIRAPRTDKEAAVRGREVRRRMVAKGLPLERPNIGTVTGPPSIQSLRRTSPGSAPAQRQPTGGGRPNPTIFSPGRKAVLEGQAKDRAALGIGFKGGLTRQGLSAKLAGVGKGTTRAKRASSPAVRDPFKAAMEKRLKAGKPATRASVNALSRA